ncbi:MAG: peptidoglycan DD-metalloendopeptidase family protein [Clostridia bacterium]|nr:peptidoglycan DD-metalloendopeptidase family protein [Clostridia bacterium]
MKKHFRRIVCFIVCMCISVTSLSVMGLTQSQKNSLNNDIAGLKQQANAIQQEINELKSQKSDQGAILSAVRKKIANTQAQIDRCNSEIASINSKMSSNKKAIASKEAEIAQDKLAFKKRLRAIYMSNSDSSVQILMGAEDFADFLQLTQLTASVSAHDKRLINDLKSEISVLNDKIAENEKLLQQQVSIKSTIDKQQRELEAQENEAASIYNKISNNQSDKQGDLNAVNAEIRKLQKQIEDSIANKNYNSFVNNNTGFQWPVSGFFGVSSHFGYRWGSLHTGMDIAGGGISGQPIRAVADGVVTTAFNGCSHNYKKYGNCCSSYGNYVVVNHGSMTINGSTANYVAYYAHASRVAVSVGQSVKQGDVLGYVGTTGFSTGYHLHFGVLKNGTWINPYPLFF